MHRLAIIPALLVVAACGGASHPTTPTPAAKVAWKDMNADQRTAFMKDVVMPRSKELFMAFDAERYKDMDCKTCHGPGAEDKSFEMPNPDIMPLDFSKMDQLDEEHKKVADWMHEVVVPKMADLLGEQPYDPATQQGFGCLGCHTMATTK